MAKKLTHSQKKKAYVEQRKFFRKEYIKENGTAKGWTKSAEYKRIKRNEYQYNRRRNLKRDNKILESVTNTDLGFDPEQFEEIASNEIFYSVLSYSGGTLQKDVEEAFNRAARSKKIKNVKLRIVYENGESMTYQTTTSSKLGLVAMYNRCLKLQKKENKYPLVSAVSKVDGDTYYILAKINGLSESISKIKGKRK